MARVVAALAPNSYPTGIDAVSDTAAEISNC